MSPPRVTVTDEGLLEAIVLLHRYSLGLGRVGARALGQGATGSVDSQILLAIARSAGASPSALVELLGIPRSTLARGLVRLRRTGLVERSVDEVDGRRAVLAPTAAGAACLTRLESALGDFLRDSAPVVKEVELILGRDPEGRRGPGRPLSVREAVDRIGAVGGAHGRDVRAAGRPFGLAETPDRYAVTYLALRESRPSVLAEHLDLTPAGTTNLLDRLEGLGLVERRTGVWPADRRAVLVRLTPTGRRATEALIEVFRRHQDDVLHALGETLRLVPTDPTPRS